MASAVLSADFRFHWNRDAGRLSVTFSLPCHTRAVRVVFCISSDRMYYLLLIITVVGRQFFRGRSQPFSESMRIIASASFIWISAGSFPA